MPAQLAGSVTVANVAILCDLYRTIFVEYVKRNAYLCLKNEKNFAN